MQTYGIRGTLKINEHVLPGLYERPDFPLVEEILSSSCPRLALAPDRFECHKSVLEVEGLQMQLLHTLVIGIHGPRVSLGTGSASK